MAGLVRFAWWREALERVAAGASGAPHPFLEALSPELATGRFPVDELLDLLAAHEAFFERRRLPAPAEAVSLADRSGARTLVLAMQLLGGGSDWCERAFAAGRALALLRLAALLPDLRQAGFAPGEETDLCRLAGSLAQLAETALAEAGNGRPPRRLLAPMLTRRLARSRLARLAQAGFDPLRLKTLPPHWPLPGLLLARLHGRP
ncbi:hypothetical protein HRbin40_00840 [bacterium HR40]|nr:hypothetical protein HRbin40_00840 [bacterium HR40]